MHTSLAAALAAMSTAVVFAAPFAFAQSELQYDPEMGIMLVDKKDTAKKTGSARPLVSFKKNARKRLVSGAEIAAPLPLSLPGQPAVHPAGRKNSPAALSFMLGLEHFKNSGYANALREFRTADSLDSKPVYRLWIGKTGRQLGQSREMLSIMQDIVKNDSRSEVADDALFEMASYYQSIDDYAAASRCYTRAMERYPSGESYFTGEKYIDVARDRRAFMRAEMSNMLAILGYTNETLDENYRAFQRHHRLKETGEGDRNTVSEIKKLHLKMIVRERLNEENNKRARRYLLWAGIAAAVGFCNLGLSAIFFFDLLAKRRLLAELGKRVAMLDTRYL